MKRREKKKIKEQRLAIKLFICLIYLIIMTILFVYTYKVYRNRVDAVSWSKVESVEDYTYINVSKMSEKFAYYEEKNIGFHFVIEQEETGIWHTYIMAIKEDDYEKYKDIIDYTYDRTTSIPQPKKVYGYPVITSQEIKDFAINNIDKFVAIDNSVKITNENFDNYLTNSYLDATKKHTFKMDITLSLMIFLITTIIFFFILTIFNKDRLVDNLDEELDKTKRLLKIKE